MTLGAKAAPSRWGTVSFSMTPHEGSPASIAVNVSVDFAQPAGSQVHVPTLMVRVRDATHGGNATIASATVVGGAGADCEVAEVRARTEIVVVRPTALAIKTEAMTHCELSVKFT